MYFAFQDNNSLYIVLDYIGGGDMRYHLYQVNHFTEEQARIYIYNIYI